MTESQSNPANDAKPSFFRRIPLAFGAFFRTLFNAEYAAHIDRLRRPVAAPIVPEPAPAPEVAPAAPPEPPPPPPPPVKIASPDAALQLLSLLQAEARLIDFTMENLSGYTDAQIGTAARVVHEGCRKVLDEHFTIEPVRAESEGNRLTLDDGFDAASIRLTGNVVGKPPFNGTLTHRGWRATDIRLPKLSESHDARVLTPAEVEL